VYKARLCPVVRNSMSSQLDDLLGTASGPMGFEQSGKKRKVRDLTLSPLGATSAGSVDYLAMIERTARLASYGVAFYCTVEEMLLGLTALPETSPFSQLETAVATVEVQNLADQCLVLLHNNKALIYAAVFFADNYPAIFKARKNPLAVFSAGTRRALSILERVKRGFTDYYHTPFIRMALSAVAVVASIALACYYVPQFLGIGSNTGPDPDGVLVPFKNTSALSTALRAARPDIDELVALTGISLGQILSARASGQRVALGPRLQREPEFSLPDRMAGFVEIPPGEISVQSGGVLTAINKAARDVMQDSLYYPKAWTADTVDDITSMLVDQSGVGGRERDPSARSNCNYFVSDAPGVKWASREMLENATKVSWESLPSHGREQGLYVFPDELRKMASRQSNRSFFNQNVAFVIDYEERDDIARKLHKDNPQGNPNPDVDTLIYPDTVAEITLEEADLFNHVPSNSLLPESTGIIQVSGDEFFVPQSKWESRLTKVISDLADRLSREESAVRARFEEAKRVVRVANEAAVEKSKGALSEITRAADQVEAAERERLAGERARVKDESVRQAQEEVTEERTRREQRQDTGGLFALGSGGAALLMKICRAYKQKRDKANIESMRASALHPADTWVRITSREYKLDNVLPVLVYAWNKLYREVGHGNINDLHKFKTMGATFEDSPTEDKHKKSLRHVLRMQDVQQAYNDIVGPESSALGTDGHRNLGYVLSDSPRLAVSSKLFWLRMYLWERVCNDQSSPYTEAIKDQLFNKIRMGPEYDKPTKCMNPACTNKKEGKEAPSTFWYTKTGQDWLLIGVPSYLRGGEYTKHDKKLERFVDELHDQRRLVGLCITCITDVDPNHLQSTIFGDKSKNKLSRLLVETDAEATRINVARAAVHRVSGGGAK